MGGNFKWSDANSGFRCLLVHTPPRQVSGSLIDYMCIDISLWHPRIDENPLVSNALEELSFNLYFEYPKRRFRDDFRSALGGISPVYSKLLIPRLAYSFMRDNHWYHLKKVVRVRVDGLSMFSIEKQLYHYVVGDYWFDNLQRMPPSFLSLHYILNISDFMKCETFCLMKF